MSRARLIFNGMLALALVGLIAALWATRQRPAPEPQTVGALAADAIHRIEIHRGDDVIVLTRTDAGRWRLAQPVAARADAAHVAAMLAIATARPERHYAPGAIDAATTGVEDPLQSVRFNERAPIAVGAPGPTPGSRYVRTAHALLLVKIAKVSELRLAWPQWLAPTLLADNDRLTQLTLPRFTLTRSKTGGWAVTPASADRGADYAQATIDAWRHSRALSIAPADASRERRARTTLRFADAPARRLDVITRTPELVLRDAALGVDYHFAANRAGPMLDMRHPAALGAARGQPPGASSIPLRRPAPDVVPR